MDAWAATNKDIQANIKSKRRLAMDIKEIAKHGAIQVDVEEPSLKK